MRLTNLNIEHVRILKEVSLKSDASFVYFCGENGSGKTSVLEAIHLLATGQSFRSTQQKNLIQYEQPFLRVRAQLRLDHAGDCHQLGIEKGRDGSTQIKHNKQAVHRIADLANILPLRSVTPDSHALVSGSPLLRRRYMDWGVFHVEQGIHFPWREYNRLLAQRNSLLKSSFHEAHLTSIDEIFCPFAESIAEARKNYCNRLGLLLPEILDSLDTQIDLRINHNQGWQNGESFAAALFAKREQCRRFRTTSIGPHRADLQLYAGGKPAREILSRGQQKLVLYALTLAQVTDFHRIRKSHMVMLCDDLQSELDESRTLKLTQLLLEQGHQLFVTGTRPIKLEATDSQIMFHVEQGSVSNTSAC